MTTRYIPPAPQPDTATDPREVANRRRRDFLDFLVKSSSSAVALAAVGSLAACGGGGSDSTPAPAPAPAPPAATPAAFAFGVASGDPLTDRVILWAHAKVPDSTADVALTWDVANDAAFKSIVRSGTVTATADASFTAKVDVTGLTAGASYFYRFRDATGATSTVGTTRTLPAADVASVKFAVFSCTLYSEGYFHAYDAAAQSDAQYALHLGDYIYEYGSDPKKYGNSSIPGNRVASPANDIVTMNDYRTRHALYKSDLKLQAAHARMPWITVWDDHETANNGYVNGAENHDPATQGDWVTRKNIAAKVYHEWMPIRTPDPANLLKIYRRFDFGSLFTLHMIDTRLEGRDRQYDNFGDADGGIARYLAGITPNASGIRPDASRQMMSAEQQNWLTAGMQASSATWQLLGNQTIMARMWLPGSVLSTVLASPATAPAAISAFLTAKATRAAAGPGALTPTQTALLDPATNPRLPYNLDSWDGYPAQREAILQTVKTQGKRLVTLSGDSHNAWFTQLTTLAGDKVGVEFAGTSVTSTGFESAGLGTLASSIDGSALVPQLGNAAIGAGLGLIDDVSYCDTTRRGYLVMTVTAAQVKGEYVYVSSVKETTYTVTVGRTITVAATAGGTAVPVIA
ncbi:alkaline phosphatase D family protein [Variovorax arabinosiphilus]|uniref:alkaline phosphatase D family protein n=1 Tax=Variovorax arabinosiphilus TaxID=3053498 RepID=UPI0025783CCE|nr:MULTISPECIES: alkaline phosphatase D family protein [unclassified Variovorax]MDM0119336.1 alkaline phosphatase D family protein [Variovorax sp. J2L1-78]MDM0129762.1 alkaline phosphatase D family protein [Variovorax sp. J2L1-63]MDM0232452.1 alkaline phosphatase D family protein [Variovorax sp. J2R1-6]